MSDRVKASLVGIAVTFALLALAMVAATAGHSGVARAIFWQNSMLQALAPLNNIGTAESPLHEGTPLNLLAFLASIPLGFVIYGVVAYLYLRAKRRGA